MVLTMFSCLFVEKNKVSAASMKSLTTSENILITLFRKKKPVNLKNVPKASYENRPMTAKET
jgi:hypothetical protein